MMNRKLAVAMFALPFGVSFLLTKSVSASEVAYQPAGQTPILVAQRYDDRQDRDHGRVEIRRDERRVWVPGHYKPGFLGIFRIWVDGHWERR